MESALKKTNGTASGLDLSGLNENERSYVESVLASERQFHDWLRSRSQTTEKVKSCLDLSLNEVSGDASVWADRALQSKATYEIEHVIGWKLWTKNAETFAAGAAQFMKDFEPFVQFASNSGPYGNLAVGTLSAFFAIAKSKKDIGDLVASALNDVKDRLPVFKLLSNIYNNSSEIEGRLRALILIAHSCIVDLAIQAAKFYLKSGPRRWWTATWAPGEFKALAGRVQQSVVAVRTQCEDLVTIRVDEIRKSNNDIRKDNQELKMRVQEIMQQNIDLQADNDLQKMMELQSLLGLSDWSHGDKLGALESYAKDLGRTFAQVGLYQTMDVDRIMRVETSQHFEDWRESKESSTLLVVGSNYDRMHAQWHCWVSPLAVHMIQSLLAKPAIVAFYTFAFDAETAAHLAVADIVLQLLQTQAHILRENEIYTHLHAESQRYCNLLGSDQVRHSAREAINSIGNVARAVARALPTNQTIYVIVDRADRCTKRFQKNLLWTLMSLCHQTPCRMKILIVAHDRSWTVDPEDEPETNHPSTLSCIKLKQETIGMDDNISFWRS